MGLTDFYEHGIARGVVRYARGRPDWDLYGFGWMFQSIGSLERWDGDGLVARIESGRDADRLARPGCPLSTWRARGAGRASARSAMTIRQRARSPAGTFRRSDSNASPSAALRVSDGRACVVKVSAPCWGRRAIPVFEESLSWWEKLRHSERLESWIRALPHPVALFACNDTAGLKVAAACRNAGLSVPRDVAILGVDNEDILCELCVPPLSSVMLDCEQIGYRAAELLARMLERSGSPGASPQLIAPREVVERSSTHVLPSADPLVEKAVAFIRSMAGKPLRVAGLLKSIPASRRSLEIRFRRALGRSVHDEIVRVRIERARELLRTTTLTVAAIAASSGFGNPQRFHEAFRRAAGMTPGAYRRSHQR